MISSIKPTQKMYVFSVFTGPSLAPPWAMGKVNTPFYLKEQNTQRSTEDNRGAENTLKQTFSLFIPSRVLSCDSLCVFYFWGWMFMTTGLLCMSGLLSGLEIHWCLPLQVWILPTTVSVSFILSPNLMFWINRLHLELLISHALGLNSSCMGCTVVELRNPGYLKKRGLTSFDQRLVA